jgi:hypothetical protein
MRPVEIEAITGSSTASTPSSALSPAVVAWNSDERIRHGCDWPSSERLLLISLLLISLDSPP